MTTPTKPIDTPRLILTGYVYTRINGVVTRRYAVTTVTRPTVQLIRTETTSKEN